MASPWKPLDPKALCASMREAAGLSPAAAAAANIAVGKAPRSIEANESGERRGSIPRFATLLDLAEAFGGELQVSFRAKPPP